MRLSISNRWIALFAAIALFLPGIMLAQNIVTGGISGTVTDPSGAVIPNAQVTLKSNATGETQATASGATGLYNFPLLKPGTYKVTVSQTGFRTLNETVEVPLGQVATANLKLVVGNTSETVEVTGAVPLLQTEDANISTTYGAAQIANLPAPGGDITSYAQTAPGVLMNTGGAFGNFSAFGLPATSNLFTLNGNDENDPFLNLNNSGSSNLLLGQNEVQEVAVVSNGYTAQYGRQAGVQVDYSTKSGSNAFHGNGTYWYNSSGFNANDWFQKQAEVASGQPNQQPFAVNNMWAGSIGGPIKKDKLFFFVDQEGLYYSLPSIQTVNLPTTAFMNNVLANIATNSPAQSQFYQQEFNLYKNSAFFGQAQNNLNPAAVSCGFPSATAGVTTSASVNGVLFGGGTGSPTGLPCSGSATASGVNHNKEWLLTERIDYNISNNDKLFGRFKADHGSQPTSTDLILPAVFSTKSNQPEYEGQINETHIFSPTIVNNFIVSGLWYTAVFLPDSGQAAAVAANGYSSITFNSGLFSTLGGTGTPLTNFPQGRNSSMGQVTDDLSITRGAHTFKTGLNFRRDVLVDYDAQANTGGGVAFGSLLDFANGTVLAGNGDSFTQVYTQNGDVRFGFYSMGLYFQDEYRVTPNLKLTMAIRGDRNSNPVCSQDCFSRLVSPFTQLLHNETVPYNQIIDAGTHSAFPAVEKLALQPRFGFTWSPRGFSNTVLRGGVGVFSDLYQGILMDALIGNSPLTNTFTVRPSTAAALAPGAPGSVAILGANSNASFLSSFAGGGTLSSILASNPSFTPPNYAAVTNQVNNPKYLEWNFEIQQAIGPKMSLNVDYVGTHGYDGLIQNGNLNASNTSGLPAAFGPGATFVPFGQLPAATVSSGGVILSGTDPRFGAVREISSTGISNYAGLVTTFTRRFTHGFQGSVNYTWSHSLDDLTTTNPGTPFNLLTSAAYQINPYCLSCSNYSNGDGDARHNLTANYVWELPFKTGSKMLNEAVSGWTLGGTFFAHSGLPYTPEGIQAGTAFTNASPAVAGLFPAASIGNVPVSCQSSGPGNVGNATPCVQATQFTGTGIITQAGYGDRRNSFRGLGYFDTDLNISKKFPITERLNFELGGSFFNILNHPNFGLPNPFTFTSAFGQMCSAGAAPGCNALAVQPTTPYGAFQGAGVEGRLVQIHAKFSF